MACVRGDISLRLGGWRKISCLVFDKEPLKIPENVTLHPSSGAAPTASEAPQGCSRG